MVLTHSDETELVVIISIVFNWFIQPHYHSASLCGWICIVFIILYTLAGLTIFVIDLKYRHTQARNNKIMSKYYRETAHRLLL